MNWGILSKYRNELYGLAAIWIILFHGLNIKKVKTALPKFLSFLEPILKHGNVGVEIFLFLSGICLYFSLKNNQSLKRFYAKRLSRILLPFFIIDGIFFGYICLYVQNDFLMFFKKMTFYSFWFERDGFVWFVAFIICLYLFYPFICNWTEKKTITVLSIMLTYLVCIGIRYFIPQWYISVEIALTRIPVFLLGCFVGEKVYNNLEISSFIKGVSLIFVVYGFGYFYQHPYSLVKYYRLPYFFIGPSLSIWICIILDQINSATLNRILSVWGGISLELYLTHFVLRKIFMDSSISGINKSINYSYYILICFLGAFLISYVVKEVTVKISEKL